MLMPVPHHALLVLRLSSSIASFSWSIFLCSEERRKELKLKAELVKTARTHSNHRKKRKNCWLILLGACRMHSAVLIWGLIPYTVIKPKKSQLLFMLEITNADWNRTKFHREWIHGTHSADKQRSHFSCDKFNQLRLDDGKALRICTASLLCIRLRFEQTKALSFL